MKIEAFYSKRLASAAWLINPHPHVMKRADGYNLLQVYCRLITN